MVCVSGVLYDWPLLSQTSLDNPCASHGLQEEQQSSSSTAGRIAPFSVLALPLFSIAHFFFFFFFATFESFELKFSKPGISVVQKNKMIQLFWSLGEEKHVLFCSHWRTLLTHPPCPLSPVVLCCGLILFSLIALGADLRVNNLAVGSGFQTVSDTGAPKPWVGTKPMDLEAELGRAQTDTTGHIQHLIRTASQSPA